MTSTSTWKQQEPETLRADIQKALDQGTSTFQYIGEPTATRGQYGENVMNVHRLAWEIPTCPECNDKRDCLDCTEEYQWHESAQGHTWGVWDATFGWQVWFHLTENEIGSAVCSKQNS